MVKIVWSQRALTDIEDIVEYISMDSIKYAKNVVRKIYNSVKFLKENSKLGRIVPEINKNEIRELINGNYRIVYQIGEKNIEIVTIQHSARLFKL